MYKLRFATPAEWTEFVLDHFDSFIIDHAACEKKASGMAMTFVAHYPDRKELVDAMVELAVEELVHFKEVYKLMVERNLRFTKDEKDPYINQFFKAMRKGSNVYFMDRLLIASIVEARGHERFGLVAEALEEGSTKKFYKAITQSEGRHLDLFINLANLYHDPEEVSQRLDELLDFEAEIVKNLEIRAALH